MRTYFFRPRYNPPLKQGSSVANEGKHLCAGNRPTKKKKFQTATLYALLALLLLFFSVLHSTRIAIHITSRAPYANGFIFGLTTMVYSQTVVSFNDTKIIRILKGNQYDKRSVNKGGIISFN